MWKSPSATEMRFGFEVTMYVNNKWYSLLIVINKKALFMGAFLLGNDYCYLNRS